MTLMTLSAIDDLEPGFDLVTPGFYVSAMVRATLIGDSQLTTPLLER